jgi:hypothetical protein
VSGLGFFFVGIAFHETWMVTLSCKSCYFQVPTLSLSLCLSIGNYQILYPCYTEQLGYRVLIYILVLKKNTNHVWPEAISTLLLININLVWDMEIISGPYFALYHQYQAKISLWPNYHIWLVYESVRKVPTIRTCQVFFFP